MAAKGKVGSWHWYLTASTRLPCFCSFTTDLPFLRVLLSRPILPPLQRHIFLTCFARVYRLSTIPLPSVAQIIARKPAPPQVRPVPQGGSGPIYLSCFSNMSDSVVPSRQVDEHISSPGGTSFQGPNGSRQNPTGESTVVDFTTVRGKAVQGSTADCGPTLDKPPTAESGHEGQDKSPRQGADDDASPATDKPRLSQPLKWTLLFIFSLAMFIDGASPLTQPSLM